MIFLIIFLIQFLIFFKNNIKLLNSMYDIQKGKYVIKDYVNIMFRKTNEIYHHKTVNKLLYYENNFINSIKSKNNWNNNNLFFTGGCDSIIKLWIDNNYLNLLSNFEYHSN